MTSSDLQEQLNLKAISLLHEDADKILKLIEVQMENLATRYCPLYEEVLDTQMYGFSKEVDFAVRAGLLPESTGKQLISKLERNLAVLYEAMNHPNSLYSYRRIHRETHVALPRHAFFLAAQFDFGPFASRVSEV